jgi:glycosyltransferase involved in cell wall biosynthesis
VAVVGSGRSVHVLVRAAAIAARGHAVRLVTLGDVLPSEEIEVRTRPLPRSLPAALAAARSFFRDIVSFQPDLLHLHYAGGPLGTLATLSRVRPLVATVMGGDVLPERHPRGMSRLERRASRRVLEEADLILAKSDALRPAIARFGDFASKVETVRWGIDPRHFHRQPEAARRLRERLGLAASDRPILSPRTVNAVHNIQLLVEAMPRILEAAPQALLLLTEPSADPSYKREVEGRIAGLRLGSRVRFIGGLAHPDMPALYSLAEVMVGIPRADGLPQSLFEAMACGTPAVLGRIPAYAEAVEDGRTALLVDLCAEAVATAVARLLTEPSLAAAISSAALERVSEIALLPREAERVEGYYRRLLSSPRQGRRPWARGLDALSLLARGRRRSD